MLLIQHDVVYEVGSNQNIGLTCIKNATKKQMKCFDKSNPNMPCILRFLDENFVVSDDAYNEKVVHKEQNTVQYFTACSFPLRSTTLH